MAVRSYLKEIDEETGSLFGVHSEKNDEHSTT